MKPYLFPLLTTSAVLLVGCNGLPDHLSPTDSNDAGSFLAPAPARPDPLPQNETGSLRADPPVPVRPALPQDISMSLEAAKIPLLASQDLASPGGGSLAAAKQSPRLIKNANLVLFVASISDNLPKITQLLAQYEGDTLSLEETRISDTSSTATLVLRIPQQHLETVIDKLLTLGQVEKRVITTQDVSEEIFDFAARLRNLARAEESILAILNRSGSIAEVLAVTQELSNVRQQIEQLTGQLSRLENQVTYSRVTITLTEERPVIITEPTLWEQLGMTLEQAAASLADLGVSGLKALIWILAYSPLVIVPVLLLKWWWGSKLR